MKEQTSVWCIGGMLVSLLLIQSAALAQIGPSRAQSVPSTRADESGTTVINVTGTIISSPPCTINNDVDLDYDFGEVIIQQIKSEVYQATKSITINCQLAQFPNINLAINGVGKENTLETNVTGLGVALFNDADGKSVELGKKISLPLESGGNTSLALKAVVVNPDDTVLKVGNFKTTATLTTSYD